jgi:N-acetyl sugar amidotransferase
MNKNLFWCTKCLNMSTRPRIEFDAHQVCNACQWSAEKKTFDWASRGKELNALLDKHRRTDGRYDVLVPVSGGKDGSYVAHQLKHVHGMTPLCVTIRPPLEFDLGSDNLQAFVNSGYEHVHITMDPEIMRQVNRSGFAEQGRPLFGWTTGILSAVIRTAVLHDIAPIFYGEDGEMEYGGSTESKNTPAFDVEYIKRIYLSGEYKSTFDRLPQNRIRQWTFPEDVDLNPVGVFKTHWSYFEAWDSYRNYLVAKEHCGLKEREDSSAGTFTNFAQNDTAMYALHTYLMYLKFGFGRATQDSGIEIRRGALTREQAKPLVKLYDNQYPAEYLDQYLAYYRMTEAEFDAVLDRHVNRGLFEKRDGRWEPLFELE